MGVSLTWLDVSYQEKDEAKTAGARWDAAARHWYAPPGREDSLERWLAGPALPELLPGEDRTLGEGLFVDLVPSSCWFTNVRSSVSPRDWERLRRMITDRAGRRCEVCGAAQNRDVKRWLEARAVGVRRGPARAEAGPADLPVYRLSHGHALRAGPDSWAGSRSAAPPDERQRRDGGAGPRPNCRGIRVWPPGPSAAMSWTCPS
ncbi:DUF5710 domain-containing protein [Streptomyces sp. NPDC054884]